MVGFSNDRFPELPVIKSLAEEMTCGICHQIYDNPVETYCKHTYCCKCIKKWIRKLGKKSCPKCNKSLTTRKRTQSTDKNHNIVVIDNVLVDKNLKVYAMVGKLLIKCDFEAEGCPNVCPLELLPKHLKTFAFRKCKTCGQSTNNQSMDVKKELIESKDSYKSLENEKKLLTQMNRQLETKLKESEEKIVNLESKLIDSNRGSNEVTNEDKTQTADMTAANDQQFCIDCSDDENYDNNDSNDRVVDGKRVWEPSGTDISRLYRELEAKGFIELRWLCPGRRSPSVHNLGITPKPEPSDGPVSDTKSDLMNEFDFEADFNGDQPVPAIGAKAGAQPKRRAPGPEKQCPKKQTNLNKVMADIKKYQFIDHTKRLTIQTTTTAPVPTPTPTFTPTPTPPTTTPMTSLPSTPVSLPTPTAPAPSTPTTASSPVTPLLVSTAQSILTTTTTADSLLPSTVTMSVTPVTTTSTPIQSLSAVRSDSPTDIL
ncbi:unnamed protein product [Medioppia subpectinata]|uniref:RING-type domain-containing protein n=1 Tax=Medioppia subpectinata TaxID=1979941 RepID=A0A7R9KFJ2_9ACAR|nr:unnamed protein product [Medioppia subpectinata]CAG2101263.1 unnamed protein product [Medioppia subpectinata]